ncbi:MAG TPA: hypothetical protein VFK84_19405 [Burkholderiales bacterium]|nr:hypothetical protein [Burkholderiales bacterium]
MVTIPAGWKPFSLGALAGAIIITWTGFDALGWKTASAAETLAKRRADVAVVSAMASVCDAKFRQAANFPARLATLQKADRYARGDLVQKAGFATMPGSAEPNHEIGQACAELLIPAKS